MADDSKDEVTVTVLDEIEQDETAVEETPMEVEAEPAKEVAKPEEKKKPRKRWAEDDVEDSDDLESEGEEEEEDPVKAEEARVNPRLNVIVHPLLFKDLVNIKEMRAVIRQSDHFEVAFYRLGKTLPENRPYRSKRGYARLSFRTSEVAYWVLDNLRNMKIQHNKTATLLCSMTNRETASGIMHPTDGKHSSLKNMLQEIKEQDISLQALYFGNLPKAVTSEKLQEFIPEAKEIFMPLFKGKARGYAYVEFESKEQAEECLKTYKAKKMEESTLVVRNIGSGKTAHFLNSSDPGRRYTSSNGRAPIRREVRRGTGRGSFRPRSPPRGPPRRYQGPIWENWSSGGDRKRRFVGADVRGPPVRRDPFRRERMDDYDRGFRREYRDRIMDDMRLREDLSRSYMPRGYDRGFGGDPWLSSSSFGRPSY